VATVYDYFRRACRRDPEQLSGIAGEKCIDSEGNSAVFSLEPSSSGVIESAQYRCTTCFTLVALCERLADELTGSSVADAASWTAERLLSLHPEIPAMRHDRAMLAVTAVQSAVRKYTEGDGY
jgi:hypothetical protein